MINPRFILKGLDDKRRLVNYLDNLPREPILEVTVKPYKRNRSDCQNRLFHHWMNEVSTRYADQGGKQTSPEVWKEFFKREFLGFDVSAIKGKAVSVTRGTSGLNTKEFSEFLEKVDHFCTEELGIVLPRPVDLWLEAMGRG